jgi:hypothetical protein
MEKQKISKSKVEGKAGVTNHNGQFSVIVKVTRAGYVPAPLTLRSHINAYLFTADATKEAIQQLEKDAEVASVSISQPIKSIK